MQCFRVKYRGICHIFSVYTCQPLGEYIYEENTSDKCHVPRYPTRKHCITTLYHAYIFGQFTEIFGKVQIYPVYSKTVQNSKPFLSSHDL